MHEKVMENDNAATDAIELIISDPEQQQEQPNFIQVKENKSCNTNVCEFCGKSFGSINELELHVKVHTHEKPFECMVCFTAFATRSAMRIHEKIHTGEEQHVCHHCHLTCVSRYMHNSIFQLFYRGGGGSHQILGVPIAKYVQIVKLKPGLL